MFIVFEETIELGLILEILSFPFSSDMFLVFEELIEKFSLFKEFSSFISKGFIKFKKQEFSVPYAI